jgi:hypothetical protein
MLLALQKEGKALNFNGHVARMGSTEINHTFWLENLE